VSRAAAFYRRLRRENTRAEATLWYALRNRRFGGYKFRRQHPIAGYVADFVCIDAKLVIEVDGETHSTGAERRKDAERTHVLEAAGYFVLRFDNDDIRRNLSGILDAVWMHLNLRATL
jgi:very-short-patch-repair endonuclease